MAMLIKARARAFSDIERPCASAICRAARLHTSVGEETWKNRTTSARSGGRSVLAKLPTVITST